LGLGEAASVDKDAADEDPKRIEMAAQREVQTDTQAHVRDYSRFIALMKWGTIISFLIGALVVVLIA
jgi:hypothetical protein